MFGAVAAGEDPRTQRNQQQQRDFRGPRHPTTTESVRGDRQRTDEYAAATTA